MVLIAIRILTGGNVLDVSPVYLLYADDICITVCFEENVCVLVRLLYVSTYASEWF